LAESIWDSERTLDNVEKKRTAKGALGKGIETRLQNGGGGEKISKDRERAKVKRERRTNYKERGSFRKKKTFGQRAKKKNSFWSLKQGG